MDTVVNNHKLKYLPVVVNDYRLVEVFFYFFLEPIKEKDHFCGPLYSFGALDRNRTRNLLVRSQTLYPVELQAHFCGGSCRIRTSDH